MPPRTIIKIMGADSACQKLILSDAGHSKAGAGDTIIWQIATSEVSKIDSITAKDNSTSIWKIPPAPISEKQWRGVINSGSDTGTLYFYNIYWATKTGKSIPYDPLIYIKPGGGYQYQFYSLTTVVFFIILLITTLLTWITAQKKAIKKLSGK